MRDNHSAAGNLLDGGATSTLANTSGTREHEAGGRDDARLRAILWLEQRREQKVREMPTGVANSSMESPRNVELKEGGSGKNVKGDGAGPRGQRPPNHPWI
jgi:hypothetical protein